MLVEMKEPLERLTVPIGGARKAASGKQPQNLATERPQNVAIEKHPELVTRSPGIELIDNQYWSKYLAREEEWGKRVSKLDAEDVPLAQKLHDHVGHMVRERRTRPGDRCARVNHEDVGSDFRRRQVRNGGNAELYPLSTLGAAGCSRRALDGVLG